MARVAQVTSNSRKRKPSPTRTQRTGLGNHLRRVLGAGRAVSVVGDDMAISLEFEPLSESVQPTRLGGALYGRLHLYPRDPPVIPELHGTHAVSRRCTARRTG